MSVLQWVGTLSWTVPCFVCNLWGGFWTPVILYWISGYSKWMDIFLQIIFSALFWWPFNLFFSDFGILSEIYPQVSQGFSLKDLQN